MAGKDSGQMPFTEVSPSSDPVDPDGLLLDLRNTLQRHIVADDEVFVAAALWVVHTYLIDQFDVSPLLVITAPEMRCGKSEFRRLLGRLVDRPIQTDNMTPAVLFRIMELWKPTLLVDEFDTFVKSDEALRGIFNSGHQRGGCVWRCVGDDFTPTRFNVFGPKVLAGIGRVAPTLSDRAVLLPLRRKLTSESVVQQREVPDEYFEDLRSRVARFALDRSPDVRVAAPCMPHELNDRARDNWAPLFQIAIVAGGNWPSLARKAALKLSGSREESKSVSAELLEELKEMFELAGVDRLSSVDIVRELCADDERRWATINRGAPITPAQVAKRLREFGIISRTIRVHNSILKGYLRSQFDDAFTRYVTPSPVVDIGDVTPSPPSVGLDAGVTSMLRTDNPAVTQKSSPDMGCDGVTAEADVVADERRSWLQDLAFSEARNVIVQDRMNAFLDEHGQANFNVKIRDWQSTIGFEQLTDHVGRAFRKIGLREPYVKARVSCLQLLDRGDLVNYGNVIDLQA